MSRLGPSDVTGSRLTRGSRCRRHYTRKPQITGIKQRATTRMITSNSKGSYMKKSGQEQ